MRILHSLCLFFLPLLTACGAAIPTSSPTPPPVLDTPTSPPTNTPPPLPTATFTQPAAAPLILDDFEAAQTSWTAGTDAFFTDSSAIGLALTSEHATRGKQALQLTFEQNDKPKAIFFLDTQLDLSQAHYLQFDLYNPGNLSSVGIAMLTGPDKVWYESDGFTIGAGKQATLSFDLTAGTYKAASTNWEFTASIPDLNNVSRLAFILYPAASGSVFIDALRTSNTP